MFEPASTFHAYTRSCALRDFLALACREVGAKGELTKYFSFGAVSLQCFSLYLWRSFGGMRQTNVRNSIRQLVKFSSTLLAKPLTVYLPTHSQAQATEWRRRSSDTLPLVQTTKSTRRRSILKLWAETLSSFRRFAREKVWVLYLGAGRPPVVSSTTPRSQELCRDYRAWWGWPLIHQTSW